MGNGVSPADFVAQADAIATRIAGLTLTDPEAARTELAALKTENRVMYALVKERLK